MENNLVIKIDPDKFEKKPLKNFKSGLNETFIWYYANSKFFKNFSKKLFFKRLGLKK